ncbi:MAG: PhnD/SsuA/transferrin family substrate-binding protein [Planctomycetes bacterium]|nr:PhnD/SsuA/transferrin family substrate-binding protein [Planctomycetota bacterium]
MRRRLLLLPALLLVLSTSCARSGFSQTEWNPFGLQRLFGGAKETVHIAIMDTGEGVFDTADWAFIKRRAPWQPLARALSSATGHRVLFRQLKPFQIAYHLKTGRCQFALVSRDGYDEILEILGKGGPGSPGVVLLETKVRRRQGVIVANVRSEIRALLDLHGKRFAFGPRDDPVLFFSVLELLDRAGISPSDLKQEIVLTGFEGALQHHPTSRRAAREIVYGRGTDVGVIAASDYDAYRDTGGRWAPIAYTFSKDQFVELARTDVHEAVTLKDARFLACESAPPELVEQFRSFLLGVHESNPEALAALGFSRFEAPREQDTQEEAPPGDPKESRALTGPATDEEIARLIRDLSESSYATRTHATRRLCAIGTRARNLLLAASENDDMEAALRAKHLLGLLDRLHFTGTEITLAFSKSQIRWDDPVDLRITMLNRSDFPARIPFELDATRRADLSPDALQVGDMLDVADWLNVQTENGRTVELRVDDMLADPGVRAAVESRAEPERDQVAPGTLVQPGESATLVLRSFNRGWARYPLLERGTYTVALEYVPAWNDEVLLAQGVGRVASNEASITVVQGAPQGVSRDGVDASVLLTHEGEELVATLVNRTDQLMIVNKDFGASPPFADGRWVCALGNSFHEVPVAPGRGGSWNDFDPSLLADVQPGHSVELARIGIDDLQKIVSAAELDLPGETWSVRFNYASLVSRQWQALQGAALLGNDAAPACFQRPLSRRILSGRYSSDTVSIPKVP